MVDFVPFPGLASTDNNTQYQANSVVTTANSGTVIAATSMVIYPQTGFVGLGTTLPSQQLEVYTGNLKLSSTGQRIFGDFSNATLTNRTSFQTTTTNGNSTLPVITNGTGTQAGINLHNASTPDNSGYLSAYASSSTTAISADKAGTGSYLPIGFFTSGSERMRISTAGNIWMSGTVGVGTSTSSGFGNSTSNLYVWGNVVIANTSLTSSGLIFPDGTRQTSAAASTPSYGPVGTIQVAGASNTLTGDGSLFVWDNTNKRLGIGTSTPAYLFSLYGTDYVLFNNRPGNAARQEITVGNVIGYGSVLGYDPSIGQSIGYVRRGDSAATSPAITWAYVSSNYRVGINAITQPQNTMDIAGAVAIGTNYSGFGVMTNANGLSVQGSVGVGTFTPGSTLDVWGVINSRTALSTAGAATVASITSNSAAYTTGVTVSNGNISVGSTAAAAAASISVAYLQGIAFPGSSGNGFIYGMNTDGASSTLSNMQIRSWFGIGFGPSITGQTIPINENAVWMNVRTGDMAVRGSLAVGTATPSTAGAIFASNEITAYSSDGRLKENIELIADPIGKVMRLRGVMFDWKPDTKDLGFEPVKTHDVGVIAQEVQAVLPEAVRPAPFDVDSDGQSKSGENYLTVQYEKLTALLIEAVKAQQVKIDELEARLSTVELDPWQ